MKETSLCTGRRFGVGGELSSRDNYATYKLSLYDFWYVYHPKEWKLALDPLGIAPVVRKRKQPLILRKHKDGRISVILCRNGWVLADACDGRQTRNLMMRPYGDGMVWPTDGDTHSSKAERQWATDHGYLHPYRARTWCHVHRVQHGHVNFASPTFDECLYADHPQWHSEFRSIPQDTFRCSCCGKHQATIRKERHLVWKETHDRLLAARPSIWDRSISAIWDLAREAERAYTCCAQSRPAEMAA